MNIYLPIAEMPVSVLTLLALSATVGFVSGLFGIGGGFLLTPLLIFLGIPPGVAVATSAAQITAASTTGALSAWRRKTLDFKLAAVLIAGGVAGTLLGVLFFNTMRRLGQLELVISLGYVTLLSIVGGLMLWERLNAMLKKRSGQPASRTDASPRAAILTLPWRMRFHRAGVYVSVIPILTLAFVIGFLGAVLGIGGGFMLVPAIIYLLRVRTSVAVGTSLLQILVTMAAATLFHAVSNQSVDIVLALLLIIGGSAGAQFGARAGQNLKSESFRLMLALLILAVAIRFASELAVAPFDPFSIIRLGGAT
ncbi:MAG: sulfite exporter TauE/SafE family protein [Bosea sp. (in: a-proteobacteria)]